MLRLRIKHKIKILSLPVRTVLAHCGVFFNRNEKRLWSLKDKHLGEECVLIGMGPSLKPSDLELFKDYKTFACNKIFLALEDTDWRPDYYFVSDVLVAENNKEMINTDLLVSSHRVYTKDVARELGGYGDPTVVSWASSISKQREPRMRSNPLSGILGGGRTVLFEMLQIAYIMGFKKIYIVGLDFSFEVPKLTGDECASGEIVISEGEVNHFHPDYRKPGETWTVPMMAEQELAFSYAAKVFKKAGIELYNASRETKLEALEKVEFNKVFGNEAL
jgi:hypothetical protein